MPTESVSFDRAAHFYDETRGFPPGEDKKIGAFIAHAAGLNSTSQVLEIGIGTGRIALPLAPFTSTYIGIDISQGMMGRLRSKETDKHIFLAQADAAKLPFESGTFDAVLAVHVFHLIANWRGALDEIARVLKPDGRLLRCWDEQAKMFRIMREAQRDSSPPEHRQTTGVEWERYDTFLEQLGWRPVAPKQHHHYHFTRIPQTYVQQIKDRIWSGTWKLTDEQLAENVKAVQEAINANFPNPNEPVDVKAGFNVHAYLPPE